VKENEILEEIHRVRAEHAAECGYDVKVMFARMDAELERLRAEGWQVVAPASPKPTPACAVREEPPKQ
jgi:hypothetical protein